MADNHTVVTPLVQLSKGLPGNRDIGQSHTRFKGEFWNDRNILIRNKLDKLVLGKHRRQALGRPEGFVHEGKEQLDRWPRSPGLWDSSDSRRLSHRRRIRLAICIKMTDEQKDQKSVRKLARAHISKGQQHRRKKKLKQALSSFSRVLFFTLSIWPTRTVFPLKPSVQLLVAAP